jgi:hypothetical protein
MSHLNLETLARLLDDAPDAAEKAHLEVCADCRQELEDMRADLAALQSLPAMEPPAGEWSVIEARLGDEGLMRRPHGRIAWRTTGLRAAAAVLIFLLGGATGATWTGNRPDRMPGVIASGSQQTARDEPRNVLAEVLISGQQPRTREEATLLLSEAEALYLDAMQQVSELSSPGDGGDPVARLAALEGITAITRAALDRAPADPVLNGYHITAVAQREAILRQLAAAMGGSWF